MAEHIKKILKAIYDIKPVKNGEVDIEKIKSIKEKIDLSNYLYGKKAVQVSEENIEQIIPILPKQKRWPQKIINLNLAKKRLIKLSKPILVVTSILIISFGTLFLIKNLHLNKNNNKVNFEALLISNFQNFIPKIKKQTIALNENIKALDFKSSKENLEEIYNELLEIDSNISGFNKFLVSLPIVNKYYPLLDSFSRIKIIIKTTINSLDTIDGLYNKYLFGGILGDPEYHRKTIEGLDILEKNNKIIFSNLKNLNNDINKISKSSLSTFFSDKIELFKEKYLFVQDSIIEANKYINEFKNLLGVNEERNYFIILQNESEIRPTGGFIGSLARINLIDGKLTEIKFFDIYVIDGQIKKEYIPPHQLWSITPVWKTRDANWFFDFPKSAKKIEYFLNSSAFFPKTRIDGIVAINTKLFSDILNIIGPISLKEYGEINSQNFLGVLQYNTELGPDSKAGEPKKILKIIIPKIFDKLAKMNQEEKREFLEKIIYRFRNKDIQLYFKNTLLENEAKKFNIAGNIIFQPEKNDYLAVVNSNIAGGKSDIFINQKINLKSEIQEDGSIVNTLTIERHHFGQNAKYSFWRKTNKNYLKIFVPQNSQLLEAKGFKDKIIVPLVDYSLPKYLIDDDLNELELGTIKDSKNKVEISKESKKTVFGGWVYTYPGKTSKIVIKYKLPFKIDLREKNNFSLIYQKQSGVETEIHWNVLLPKNYLFTGLKSDIFNKTKKKILNYEIFKTPKIKKLISF